VWCVLRPPNRELHAPLQKNFYLFPQFFLFFLLKRIRKIAVFLLLRVIPLLDADDPAPVDTFHPLFFFPRRMKE